jgi:sialic acid synthase SpsE
MEEEDYVIAKWAQEDVATLYNLLNNIVSEDKNMIASTGFASYSSTHLRMTQLMST